MKNQLGGTLHELSPWSGVTVGVERVGGEEHFDGDVARVLVYDTALTAAALRRTGAALGSIDAKATARRAVLERRGGLTCRATPSESKARPSAE